MSDLQLTKLQRRLIWASIIALWVGVGFCVWLAWSMIRTADCYNWQNRPLDQVSRRCLK